MMTTEEKIDALGQIQACRGSASRASAATEGIHGWCSAGARARHRAAITTTQFPQPPGMGESWDPELVRQAGWVEGHEARWITQTDVPAPDPDAVGPQADLARDPRWGRSEEVYGEDPFLNGTMATAFAKGFRVTIRSIGRRRRCSSISSPTATRTAARNSSSDFDERLF